VVNECIGEIVPGEKLFRLHVIGGRGFRYDLLQVNGKLAGIERAALAEFLARENDFVPGFHLVIGISETAARIFWFDSCHQTCIIQLAVLICIKTNARIAQL